MSEPLSADELDGFERAVKGDWGAQATGMEVRLLATVRQLAARLRELESENQRLAKPDRLTARWKNVGAIAEWRNGYLGIQIGDLRENWPDPPELLAGSGQEGTDG